VDPLRGARGRCDRRRHGQLLDRGEARARGPEEPEQQIFRKEYLDKTHAFFERWGGIAIILGRFVPFVRTFAPFLAGVGSMQYRHFLAYNVIGGLAWVGLFAAAGHFFGGLAIVQNNLSWVLIGVIVITLIPFGWESSRRLRGKRA